MWHSIIKLYIQSRQHSKKNKFFLTEAGERKLWECVLLENTQRDDNIKIISWSLYQREEGDSMQNIQHEQNYQFMRVYTTKEQTVCSGNQSWDSKVRMIKRHTLDFYKGILYWN